MPEVIIPFIPIFSAGQYEQKTFARNYLYDNSDTDEAAPRPQFVYDEANYISLLHSGPRESDFQSDTIINKSYKGLHLSLSVTDISTANLLVQIQSVTRILNYDILTSAAIIANGHYVFKLYPGIPEVPNLSISDILPPRFRIKISQGGTPTTYSVTLMLMR